MNRIAKYNYQTNGKNERGLYMKKVIFIILIFNVLFIYACNAGKEGMSSQEDEGSHYLYTSEQTEPTVTATVTRDFVEERYSKFKLRIHDFFSSVPSRSTTGSPEDYVSDCEKNIDNSFYYRMFQVEEGGYFYAFIRKANIDTDAPPFPHETVTHFAYVEKPMKMNDFNILSAGDTLEDVIAIDPGARFVKDYAFCSLHLCSDGLVLIVYDEYIEGQERKILSIDYSKDYTFFKDAYSAGQSEESGLVRIGGYPYYTCAVDPEDYPNTINHVEQPMYYWFYTADEFQTWVNNGGDDYAGSQYVLGIIKKEDGIILPFFKNDIYKLRDGCINITAKETGILLSLFFECDNKDEYTEKYQAVNKIYIYIRVINKSDRNLDSKNYFKSYYSKKRNYDEWYSSSSKTVNGSTVEYIYHDCNPSEDNEDRLSFAHIIIDDKWMVTIVQQNGLQMKPFNHEIFEWLDFKTITYNDLSTDIKNDE